MKVIYKYALTGPVTTLPLGAQVLRFEIQKGVHTIWALVDTDQPNEDRAFAIVGTGWPIERPGDLEYIGTAFEGGSGLVWHCFEVPSPSRLGCWRDPRRTSFDGFRVSPIVAQHEDQVHLAWMIRMVLRLREGSATTGELIEASGAKGWRQRAIVRPLVRKIPGIRCVGMEPGTRGLKTYRWEL